MKLYLLTQNSNIGYDTYDSAVVAAESEERARFIHPNKLITNWDSKSSQWHSWCSADEVEVKYIGEATEGIESGVITSSFNAG